MSIGAAVTSFEHDGRKVNMIDTPGRAELRRRHARGAAGRRRGRVRRQRRRWASRSTPIGSGGVPTQEGLARLVFVNMLDRERADFFSLPRVAEGGLRPARGRDRDPDRLRARGPRA